MKISSGRPEPSFDDLIYAYFLHMSFKKLNPHCYAIQYFNQIKFKLIVAGVILLANSTVYLTVCRILSEARGSLGLCFILKQGRDDYGSARLKRA